MLPLTPSNDLIWMSQFNLHSFMCVCKFCTIASPVSVPVSLPQPGHWINILSTTRTSQDHPFINTSTPSYISHPCTHWLVVQFQNSVTSKMLFKWNHTVCSILGLLSFFFPLGRIFWTFFPAVSCTTSSFLSTAEQNSLGRKKLFVWLFIYGRTSGLILVFGHYK